MSNYILSSTQTSLVIRLALCLNFLVVRKICGFCRVSNKLMTNPDKTRFFIASSAAHSKHLTFIFDDIEIKSPPFVKKPWC